MGFNPESYVFEYLRSGAAGENMVQDGSSTPWDFEYEVPAGKIFNLNRINFVLIDGSIQNGKFGGLTALTTGCKVDIMNDGGTAALDFLNGETIQANEDFNALSGTDGVVEPTTGDDSYNIRWTINKASAGNSMKLPAGYKIRFRIQDNLAGLTKFEAMVQGTLETAPGIA